MFSRNSCGALPEKNCLTRRKRGTRNDQGTSRRVSAARATLNGGYGWREARERNTWLRKRKQTTVRRAWPYSSAPELWGGRWCTRVLHPRLTAIAMPAVQGATPSLSPRRQNQTQCKETMNDRSRSIDAILKHLHVGSWTRGSYTSNYEYLD